jgi:hypothetical protein
MGFEKRYTCYCPDCGIEKQSRKRDVGKLCKSCNMTKVAKEFSYLKLKDDKMSVAEYCKRNRDKYKEDDRYRLNKLLQQAKIRATKRNLVFDIIIDDLLEKLPKDKKCPVLGIDLFWGNEGKGKRVNSPSIDRIDPKGNYTKDNIMIISWRANEIKSDASIEEIEAVLKYMKT